jgi:polysaccharide pyruvyl transferase WcaK-like protein
MDNSLKIIVCNQCQCRLSFVFIFFLNIILCLFKKKKKKTFFFFFSVDPSDSGCSEQFSYTIDRLPTQTLTYLQMVGFL